MVLQVPEVAEVVSAAMLGLLPYTHHKMLRLIHEATVLCMCPLSRTGPWQH